MEHIPCALCGAEESPVLFTKWNLHIVRCSRCGLAYVNPRQFAVEDDSYFRGAYLSTMEQDGDMRDGVRHLYGRIADHLETLLRPARLLDVGCAMGHFMAFARGRGWSVHGIECSAFAAAYGRERWGLPVQTACDLRQAHLPAGFFDACVMIEVIEHLPNPMDVVREVFRLLKPGGVLYVTTPNFASYQALLQREQWNAVVPTGHLYYLTAPTLAAMARAAGFQEVLDLTEADSFDAALGRIPAHEQPSGPGLDALRAQCLSEEGARLVNGRAEGLVLCAAKPLSGPEPLAASRRWTAPLPNLEGRLVTGSGTSDDDRKVYWIESGKKHWITSAAWLESRGRSLAETIQVDSRLLASLISGQPLG